MSTEIDDHTRRREAQPKAKEAPRRAARPSGQWSRAKDWPQRLKRAIAPYVLAVTPLVHRVRDVLAVVTRLGWALLAGMALFWWLAWAFGWREAAFVAAVLLVLFIVACLFTIGRQQLSVSLDVEPQRVVVGESAAARVLVKNEARSPLLPLGLEFPVGRSLARFTLPALAPQASHDEIVVIPTARRGVIPLGPVTTQRGDPFGVVRREVTWAQAVDMFVHPKTVPLEPVGSGLLRDLEGHTTNDISMSDLNFHTLREYAPGDDRRYIHWRSSAKASGTSGAGRFLVRQFLDTRRSHIAVVVDAMRSSYATEDEFELAISAGASIALRALADEMDLTIVCGDQAIDSPPPYLALDTFSRADFTEKTLAEATGMLTRLAPDASVAIFISGPLLDFGHFRQARAYLAPEVNTFAITVAAGGKMTLKETGGITVLSIGELMDLPKVLLGGQVQ